MTQYISKDAIVAEIEKRKQELHPTDTHKMQAGEKIDRDVLMWLNALTWVKKVIDTLEVKEVDFDDFGFYWGEYVSNLGGDINDYEVAKYFYELGLNSQTKDMQEALRMEYEKGRADVIADTLSWLENCWPKYCSNPTIIDGFKEAIKD